MRVSSLVLVALVLTSCGEGEPETTTAFAQVAGAAIDRAWGEDAEDDCTRRTLGRRALVIRDVPCGPSDLSGMGIAVSDRLAVAALVRSPGPGRRWVLEATVRARITREGRPPLGRLLHVRCSPGGHELDLTDGAGPARLIPARGSSCRAEGHVVEVLLPLSNFVVPGARTARAVVVAELSRDGGRRSRVRDTLDEPVTVALPIARCRADARDGGSPQVRCAPWPSPSSSVP